MYADVLDCSHLLIDDYYHRKCTCSACKAMQDLPHNAVHSSGMQLYKVAQVSRVLVLTGMTRTKA